MLQAEKPDDYIIASGETHSVKEFVEEAFKIVNLDYNDFVKTDSSLIRPTKTSPLMGNISKAKKDLDWYPKTSFKQLVKLMVDEDIKKESKHRLV